MEKVMSFLMNLMVISSLPVATYATKTGPVDTKEPWFQVISKHGNEKTAKLHFYFQDLIGGENKTVYEVVRASITCNSLFPLGSILVIDNLITAEADIKSKPIGRFQGIGASADLKTTAVALNANLYFTSGGVNGSTISVSGRSALMEGRRRELAIVGGTGMFRFAKGYAITNYTTIVENEYLLVECTVYVTYMDESRHESFSR
ncbi:dirigent protein 11-like [Sesamum indicum]|uniref:Dirigent protein n=1 Tax=Sesamum indicum TaxID=4182 RepID=A0A6I9TSP1_SESIN|nr:dirigent protein 11-like [Sesamum indicum]